MGLTLNTFELQSYLLLFAFAVIFHYPVKAPGVISGILLWAMYLVNYNYEFAVTGTKIPCTKLLSSRENWIRKVNFEIWTMAGKNFDHFIYEFLECGYIRLENVHTHTSVDVSHFYPWISPNLHCLHKRIHSTCWPMGKMWQNLLNGFYFGWKFYYLIQL